MGNLLVDNLMDMDSIELNGEEEIIALIQVSTSFESAIAT